MYVVVIAPKASQGHDSTPIEREKLKICSECIRNTCVLVFFPPLVPPQARCPVFQQYHPNLNQPLDEMQEKSHVSHLFIVLAEQRTLK